MASHGWKAVITLLPREIGIWEMGKVMIKKDEEPDVVMALPKVIVANF